MGNLAQMVMEGASLGFGSVKLSHQYDHENGAGMIAMESAEALHSIFEAEFYVPNTCTIKAAMEGVSVEESTVASVMEASIKGVFEKIKEFFIKLKEKVKQFFHNIKRYLTGIFGNDEKWIKTYEKELKAIKSSDLKGYKVSMYKYTIDKAYTKDELVKHQEDSLKEAQEMIDDAEKIAHGASDDHEDLVEKFKEDMDKIFMEFIEDLAEKKIDEDEMDKTFWSCMRDGAESEKDKDDVEVTSIMDAAITALKNSSSVLNAYDRMITRTDSMYGKVLKLIDTTKKKFEKMTPVGEADLPAVVGGGNNLPANRGGGSGHSSGSGFQAPAVRGGSSKSDDYIDGEYREVDSSSDNKKEDRKYTSAGISCATSLLRQLSSFFTKCQNAENKYNNAAKAAVVERNAVYKKALVGCFSYAKKNKGGK